MKIKSELSPPCTLKRGQVEYDKGEKKGEEGETQAGDRNLQILV